MFTLLKKIYKKYAPRLISGVSHAVSELSARGVNHNITNLTLMEIFIRVFGLACIGIYLIFALNDNLSAIWALSFPFGMVLYWIIPFQLGYYAFHFISSRFVTTRRPVWVVFPIYWLIGVIVLNIAAYLTHIFQFDFHYSVLATYLFFYGLYFLYGKEKAVSFKKIVRSGYKNRVELTWMLCGLLITAVFYFWWGWRMSFVSFNTDNLQNMNLANILKERKAFNLFAITLSPQYTQVDYATAFTPIAGVLTDIIPYRSILMFMSFMEMFTVSLVYLARFYLFKHMKLDNVAAMLVSFISVAITFSGLYMPGTIYNQQVHVFLLPSMLYFFLNKENISGFSLMLAVLPFHFTMSVFLWWTTLTLWFFRSIYPLFSKKALRGFLRIDKVIFILLLCTVLFLEGIYTFETNYQITRFFLIVLAERPQFLNSIGIYSNIAVLQIMFHGLGPLLTALVFTMPIAWIVSHRLLERWSFLIISSQLLILSIPFPVAARTFVFFSVPFAIAVYLVLQRICFKREWLVKIGLLVSILSMLVWSVTVRSNDMDITGRYWRLPFLSPDYQNALISGADALEELDIEYKDYKIVSEYFIKQHFEVMAFKSDDNGVYEENKVERGLMFDFLNGEKDYACVHYGREYVVYFINERSYKWARTPRSLAMLSSFSVWWSQPPTLVEKYYVESYEVQTTGTVIYDEIYEGYHRMIVVKC